ncbi:MAG: M43 family zinc metalloprotease [Saprospiraceae bacterium]
MRFVIVFLLIIISELSFSQKVKCGTEFNEYDKSNLDFIKDFQESVFQRSNIIQFRDITTIPIVFHVFNFEGNSYTIDKSDIYNYIGQLNLNFSSLNCGLSIVPDEFVDLIGNPNLRFCVGYREVDGEKEEGVIIKKTNTKDFLDQILANDNRRRTIKYSDEGGDDAWDSDFYINVWVANSRLILGKSSPINLSEELMGEEGILLDISNIYYMNSSLLAHELGHYFSLLHIWGDEIEDCNEDDGIPDTPQQFTYYFGCPDGQLISCGSSDMYMNYMDYTDKECSVMFTQDQVTVMQQFISQYRPGLLKSKSFCDTETTEDILSSVQVSCSNDQIIICEGLIDSEVIKIEIFDISGRLFRESEINSEQYCYFTDVSDFKTGVYLVRLSSGENIDVRKIFIF